MSLSNILVPNLYDLYCGKLTTNADLNLPTTAIFKLSANQTLTTGVNTLIQYDAGPNVPGLIYTLPATFNCVDPGVYSFCQTTVFDINATGQRDVFFQRSSVRICNIASPPSSGDPDSKHNALVVYLNTGDVVEIFAFQSSGGNLNILGTTASSKNPTSVIVTRLF